MTQFYPIAVGHKAKRGIQRAITSLGALYALYSIKKASKEIKNEDTLLQTENK